MAKYEIGQESFDSLAGKLRGMEATLSQEEKGLLETIITLAGDQLQKAGENDVAGHGGASQLAGLNVSNVGALNSGFNNSFGSFGGRQIGGGVTNPADLRSIKISVSF